MFLYIHFLNNTIKDISKQVNLKIDKKYKYSVNIPMFNKNLNNLASNINNLFTLEEELTMESIYHEKRIKETIANISHDLRTPLTAIKGYIQILDRNLHEAKQKNIMKIVTNHVDELDRLINDFFEISYLEVSKEDIQFTKINLSNIVSNSIIDYVLQFEEKNIEVSFQCENNVYVYGNMENIKRIIQNLIKNCLKYSNGDVSFSIIDNKEYVILSIKNPVEDVEKIHIDRLFDKFYIADKSRSKSSTGLGLYIVKLLCEQMNGSVCAAVEGNIIDIQIKLNKYYDKEQK